MLIVIKIFTGKHISLSVKMSDTIESIKAKIQNKEKILTNQQQLVFEGNELEDGHVLSEYVFPFIHNELQDAIKNNKYNKLRPYLEPHNNFDTFVIENFSLNLK